MEVNESFFDIDAHFENDSVYLFVWSRLTHANSHLHPVRQLLKEIRNVLWFHLRARVLVSEFGPGLLEIFEVFFETLQWVAFIKVILLKLLDNDKDE